MSPSFPPALRRLAHGLPASIPFVLVVASFLYASLFAFAQTDDLCTLGRVAWKHGNPLWETWHLYIHWTGRYSSTLAVTTGAWLVVISPVAEHWVYSAFVAAMMLVLGLSLHLALRLAADGGRGRWLPAMALLSFVMVLMPSKLEGLLWLTGAAVYTLGIAALLWQARSTGRDMEQPRGRWGISGWSLLAIALVVGFNELLALSAGGLIVLNAVAYAGRGHRARHLACFAIFMVAVLVTALAPGNFVRDSLSGAVRHDVDIALRLASESLDLFWNTRLTVDAWLVLGLVCTGLAAGAWLRGTSAASAAPFRRLWPLLVVLVTALPLYAVVYSFLTGEAMPGRVVNQGYAMALVGIGLLAVWGGLQVPSRVAGRLPAAPAMLVLGLMLASSQPFRQFAMVLRDDAPGWRSEQLARQDLLQQAREKQLAEVVLPPFAHRPALVAVLQGADISADPAYWVNGCLASYERLPVVRLQEASSPSH